LYSFIYGCCKEEQIFDFGMRFWWIMMITGSNKYKSSVVIREVEVTVNDLDNEESCRGVKQ